MGSLKPQLWVFLRGLGREKGHWGTFIKEFNQTFPEDKVLCVDLPGMGEARNVKTPTNLQGIMEFVREHSHLKGWQEEPLNLFSISLGGMVTLEWVRYYPQELNSVVIINSSVGGLMPFYRRLRLISAPHFFSLCLVKDKLRREQKIVDLISNRRDKHNQVAQAWHELGLKRPIKGANVVRQLLAASRFRLPKKMPQVPTLLMVAKGDRLTHPDCSEALHRHYGWDIVRHSWAGHDLPVDDSAWILHQLHHWRKERNF